MYTFEKYDGKGQLVHSIISSDNEGLDKLLKKAPKNAHKFQNHKGWEITAWNSIAGRMRITVM